MKKILRRLLGRRPTPARRPRERSAADLAVEDFLLRMPKVEFQVQLESCLRPAHLLSLAAKHRLELPCESEADVRKLLRFRDAGQLDRVYRLFRRSLRDAEDFHL